MVALFQTETDFSLPHTRVHIPVTRVHIPVLTYPCSHTRANILVLTYPCSHTHAHIPLLTFPPSDSKQLKEEDRDEILAKIDSAKEYVGYCVTVLSPNYISNSMMAR